MKEITASAAPRNGAATMLNEKVRDLAVALWERLASVNWRSERHLRLCETLKVGERSFVVVVEFEELRLLLGVTPTSLALLAKLEACSPRFGKHRSESNSQDGEEQ